MKTVKDTFGLSRVIEPSGAVPVTAWKLNNEREISDDECRIDLKYVHVEYDSFQQICSECGYDEIKIKAKITDIINKRGKLHNPFTDSGGIFCGKIEEMGKNYKKNVTFETGDEIMCITSTTALPMHIEEIHDIDYDYGQIFVTGYAIVFKGSPVTLVDEISEKGYTMSFMDEASSLYSVFNLAEPDMNVLIIGRDLISAVMYLNAVKKAAGEKCSCAVVIDEASVVNISKNDIKNILDKCSKSAYILDVSNPVKAADIIFERDGKQYDLTVNCEDLMGAETLAVMMTKPKGKISFTSVHNRYSQAVLLAESLGKELIIYAFDQYLEDYEKFTFDLIEESKDELDEIDRIYKSRRKENSRAIKKAKCITVDKSGKADDFIFASDVTESLIDEALNIAGYDCNVILQGETGTGKEKVLSLIHKNSSRKAKPCIKINCATIQENLAESEFFGYESGSFTGAQAKGKKGYFDMANGGILFLDEVGTLSLNLQSKLLRVLQEGEFFRVGGLEPISVNVRVICANNIPVRQLVEEGKFREDLYYRLNICTINIPPLRERKEDIVALANAFMKKYCKMYGTDKELDESAAERLTAYDWPGNVRELENLVHRLVINVRGHVIAYEDVEDFLNEAIYENLVIDLKHTLRKKEHMDFNKIIEEQEKQLISYGLRKFGTTRKAAEFLNMTQAQLMRKKQKYEL